MSKVWLTDVQQELLELARRVQEETVARADAEFARVQRVVLGDMDLPETASGSFVRDGSRVRFVEVTPTEDDGA